MKTLPLIFLVVVTGCSTSSQHGRPVESSYWHAAPTLAVVERKMRVGMSRDEFARLVGVNTLPCVSPLPWAHYDLDGGTLSVAIDAHGRVTEWETHRSDQ